MAGWCGLWDFSEADRGLNTEYGRVCMCVTYALRLD